MKASDRPDPMAMFNLLKAQTESIRRGEPQSVATLSQPMRFYQTPEGALVIDWPQSKTPEGLDVLQRLVVPRGLQEQLLLALQGMKNNLEKLDALPPETPKQ